MKTLWIVLAAAVVGCAPIGAREIMAPYPDQSGRTFAFEYTSVDVDGPVWRFEEDGSYLSFGGPLRSTISGRQNAVVIRDASVTLVSARAVIFSDSAQLGPLFVAAQAFCEKIGLVGPTYSPRLFSRRSVLYLIGDCLKPE